MKFEWDMLKAKQNISKHGVTFDEATTVFADSLSLTFEDPNHSIAENRYLIFGVSSQGNYLAVSYTDRDAKIRIISARNMTRKERKDYEQ